MTDPQSFIGRSEIGDDIADPARFVRLAATLDHDAPFWPTEIVPPLGHWLCFQPDARQSNIGQDGHPVRSDTGLLPNVDLPRRMWAGSRVEFRRDILRGAAIRKTSTLIAATPKSGRSGDMLFVTVRHEIQDGSEGPAIVEEQDIVYREAADPGSLLVRPAVAAEGHDDIERTVVPDPVMLFRYSALTFNSHRIHYDRDYARAEEGYPGLVVQGPLIATLLMDHLLRQKIARRIARYSFRAMSPMFDGEALRLGLTLDGGQARLRAVGPVGVAMTAQADFAA